MAIVNTPRESYGQLFFLDNTIESVAGNISIQIGLTESTANLVLNRNVVTSAGKTIGLTDITTGAIAKLSSNNDTIVIAGSSGLLVGNIKIFGSTIESDALSTDLQIGDPTATANLVLNRNVVTSNAHAMTVGGVFSPARGIFYIPRVLTGPQTAITVNFTTDSVIKAFLDSNLTLSFTNYTAGKVVEVWLTNTGGTARTVTHGCSATNSSDNATTFTIPSTSSAYLKYFSIDGDLANTYVTSIHA